MTQLKIFILFFLKLTPIISTDTFFFDEKHTIIAVVGQVTLGVTMCYLWFEFPQMLNV